MVDKALHALANATEDEDELFRKTVHPNIRRVLVAYGSKNLAFMREVADICLCTDDEAVMYLALGLPLLGWAPPARGVMCRRKAPEGSISEFLAGRSERNKRLIRCLGPSGDESVDVESFQKTRDEVKAGVLDGPYDSLEATGLMAPCIVPRHGILEMHGDATDTSIRNIDDLLMGEQHLTVGTLSSHRPTDADGLVSQVRAVAERFPQSRLMAWKSDFSKAFKQVPCCPTQLEYVVVAQYSPSAKAGNLPP
jgi:hypothetical protein